MTTAPHVFRHPALGFSIALPPGAEVLDDVPLAALVAVEPQSREDGFRASLVVTVEELRAQDADDVERYADASIAALDAALTDFRLIDREPVPLDGAPAIRLLAHHAVAGQAVTLEQWQLVAGGRGYTLTASCWTLDYDELAGAFAASAATFVP
jgi:hypothetical protein